MMSLLNINRNPSETTKTASALLKGPVVTVLSSAGFGGNSQRPGTITAPFADEPGVFRSAQSADDSLRL